MSTFKRAFLGITAFYFYYAATAIVAPDPAVVGWTGAQQAAVLLAIALTARAAIRVIERSFGAALLLASPALVGLAVYVNAMIDPGGFLLSAW